MDFSTGGVTRNYQTYEVQGSGTRGYETRGYETRGYEVGGGTNTRIEGTTIQSTRIGGMDGGYNQTDRGTEFNRSSHIDL